MSLFIVAIAISFKDSGGIEHWRPGEFRARLGEFRYAVYMTQFLPRNHMPLFLSPDNKVLILFSYIAMSFLRGMYLMYLAELLRFLFRKAKSGLTRICLK